MAVVDVCVHSGETLTTVRDALRNAGFSDVRSVVQDAESTYTRVSKELCPAMYDKNCYPVGRDHTARRNFSSVLSMRTPNGREQRNGIALRRKLIARLEGTETSMQARHHQYTGKRMLAELRERLSAYFGVPFMPVQDD